MFQVGCGAKGQLPVHAEKLQAKKKTQRIGPERLNWNKRWQGQRNKNPKLCIGTWNVNTLLKPGKLQELTEELAKTRLEIVAIQETRWSGKEVINPLKPELNPICYLLALLAHHSFHVSRIRVKSLTIRLLMSYIYMEHLFLMFLDHTQRRSTVGRTPLDE